MSTFHNIKNWIQEELQAAHVSYLLKRKKYDKLLDMIHYDQYLGDGISRETFRLSKRVVVKVLVDPDCRQSAHELAFYQKHYNDFSKYMCKMYGYFQDLNRGMVLFMEKVEPLGMSLYQYFEEHPDQEEAEQALMEFIDATYLTDSLNNEGNAGINRKGEVVILDCGISHDGDFAHLCTFDRSRGYGYSYRARYCY